MHCGSGFAKAASGKNIRANNANVTVVNRKQYILASYAYAEPYDRYFPCFFWCFSHPFLTSVPVCGFKFFGISSFFFGGGPPLDPGGSVPELIPRGCVLVRFRPATTHERITSPVSPTGLLIEHTEQARPAKRQAAVPVPFTARTLAQACMLQLLQRHRRLLWS